MPTRWLIRSHADVAAGDAWLGERERAALAGLSLPRRRADWRLGRWTAKAALGPDVEILAAHDGAPEPWRGPTRLPLSLSLSHRAGRALAVVADDAIVGADLERLEPRSRAFVHEWLAPEEQTWVGDDRVLRANLVWTAKEAATKVAREGLRLDVRAAIVRVPDAPPVDGWRPLTVAWPDHATSGWWRIEDGFVLTVATAPAGQSSRSNSAR